MCSLNKVVIGMLMVTAALCYGQQSELLLVGQGHNAAAGATPGIANFRGMPSTENNTTATKTNNTCATESYCTNLADPSLAGNGIIVFYTYHPQAGNGDTANTPTVYDC